MKPDGSLDFVVGDDRGLADLLAGDEVSPLLEAVSDAGAAYVRIEDAERRVLWAVRGIAAERPGAGGEERKEVSFSVFLEGEEVGRLIAGCEGRSTVMISRAAEVTARAVGGMAASSLKRMLTTEIHVQVVQGAHEELLESFHRLEISERENRDLAETLEVKVRERTAALETAMTRLLRQEAMASIAQLAAGVAHEINNPMSFVASNVSALGRYFARLSEYDTAVRKALEKGAALPEEADALRALRDRLRIGAISRDLPDLIAQTLEGSERVCRIVSDLRGFSHIDDGELQAVEVGVEIERALRVLAAEVPRGAVVERELQSLSSVRCHPGMLGVVLMQLLRNAFQSRDEGLVVRVRAREEKDSAVLEVEDNGPGIPEAIRGRIFEPFFTTREVGSGKGLGLSVAYEATRALGGEIVLVCPETGGTVFRAILPTKGNERDEIR